MTLVEIVELSVPIIGVIIAVAAFVSGVIQYRHTAHINIFRTYADKYNEILPSDIYDDWLAALKGNSDLWKDLTPSMVQYLNLIWEEFFLYRTGKIPRGLWVVWLREINDTLSSDFAKKTMREYDYHFTEEIAKKRPWWRF